MLKLPDITDWTQAIGQVVCCDCLDLMKLIPNKAIDLVLTDPPYNKNIKYDNYADNLSPQDYDKFIYKFLSKVLEKTPNVNLIVGSMLLWNWWKYLENAKLIIIKIGAVTYNREKNLRLQWCPLLTTVESNELIYDLWEDITWTFEGYFYKEQRYDHPAQTPLKLMKKCIKLFTKENDIVFDPFAGSFTTALAAEQLGRRWIACDISEKYCEIGEKRLTLERAQGKLF